MGSRAEPAVAANGVRKRRGRWTWVSRDGLSTLVFLAAVAADFSGYLLVPDPPFVRHELPGDQPRLGAHVRGLDNFRPSAADPLFGTAVATRPTSLFWR